LSQTLDLENFATARRPSASVILNSDSRRSGVDSTCGDGRQGKLCRLRYTVNDRSPTVDHTRRSVLCTARWSTGRAGCITVARVPPVWYTGWSKKVAHFSSTLIYIL